MVKRQRERWRPIWLSGSLTANDGSDLGRVRNRQTGWIKAQHADTNDKLIVNIYDRIRKKRRMLHVAKFVANAFLGPCPEGKQVEHLDQDDHNNKADNLVYLTQSENILRSYHFGKQHERPTGRASIEKYEAVFQRLDILAVTFYAPYCQRVGRFARMKELLAEIKRRHAHLDIRHPCDAVLEEFAAVTFTPDSREVKVTGCNFRNCLNLLRDGTMLRCCWGRRILAGDTAVDPGLVDGLLFDLRGQVDPGELERWLSAGILDLCRYCSIAQGEFLLVPWSQRLPVGG